MSSTKNAEPALSVIDTLERLQDKAREIMVNNGLTEEEMAYSCAMATAFIIKECQNDLAAESGFHTAVYGFIEGTKTCPPKLAQQPPKKKSLFNFWK